MNNGIDGYAELLPQGSYIGYNNWDHCGDHKRANGPGDRCTLFIAGAAEKWWMRRVNPSRIQTLLATETTTY